MRGLPLVELGIVAVLLAGCSADAGSTPAPLASPPVATAEPSPTPTLSDRAAVEAAARNYYAVVTEIGMRPEIGPYLEVTSPLCSCRTGTKKFVDNLRVKKWRVTARYLVTGVDVYSLDGDRAAVRLTFTIAPFVALDSRNRVVERATPDSPETDLMFFVRKEGRWLVESLRAG